MGGLVSVIVAILAAIKALDILVEFKPRRSSSC